MLFTHAAENVVLHERRHPRCTRAASRAAGVRPNPVGAHACHGSILQAHGPVCCASSEPGACAGTPGTPVDHLLLLSCSPGPLALAEARQARGVDARGAAFRAQVARTAGAIAGELSERAQVSPQQQGPQEAQPARGAPIAAHQDDFALSLPGAFPSPLAFASFEHACTTDHHIPPHTITPQQTSIHAGRRGESRWHYLWRSCEAVPSAARGAPASVRDLSFARPDMACFTLTANLKARSTVRFVSRARVLRRSCGRGAHVSAACTAPARRARPRP